jgi:hypothetical protein
MVVKTRNRDKFISDLEETFNSLRDYGGSSTQPSASSAYCKGNYSSSSSATGDSRQPGAITDMGAPQMIKDIQKLTGCMAAFNRFIFGLGEKGLPFFNLLK